MLNDGREGFTQEMERSRKQIVNETATRMPGREGGEAESVKARDQRETKRHTAG